MSYPNLPNGLQPRGLQAGQRDMLRLMEDEILETGLSAPILAVVPVALAPGSTPYVYTVTAIGPFGATPAASTPISVTNNASLSAAAYNRLHWGPVTGAAGYTVTRVTGGPGQGVIAVVPQGSLLECNPVGALVPAAFPLLPHYELHDTGLPVIVAP
jgi:hypothetical protein